MAHRLIYDGARHQVIALGLSDGSCPAGDFLNELDDPDTAKVAAIIHILGDRGHYANPEKFKKVEGSKVFEIKSFQIRIFCFFSSDRRLVLLYGLRKKKNKHKSADIQRAEEYREWYESQLEKRK